MYARRLYAGDGKDRQQIALSVGYAPAVARDVKAKIESTQGFNLAMARLANESNDIALEVIHEFKARGFENFSNKDLVGALNAIGGAWSRFNGGIIAAYKDQDKKDAGNRLRQVVINQIENQTVLNGASHQPIVQKEEPKPIIRDIYPVEGDPNDF